MHACLEHSVSNLISNFVGSSSLIVISLISFFEPPLKPIIISRFQISNFGDFGVFFRHSEFRTSMFNNYIRNLFVFGRVLSNTTLQGIPNDALWLPKASKLKAKWTSINGPQNQISLLKQDFPSWKQDLLTYATILKGTLQILSLIHVWRCRRSYACRSRWSPYH